MVRSAGSWGSVPRLRRLLARRAGISLLVSSGLSIVLAVLLISVPTAPSAGVTGSVLTLGEPGATQTLQFALASQTLPAGTTSYQSLRDAQADLGKQLSTLTWGIGKTTVSPVADLKAVYPVDATHVWAVGTGCSLYFSPGTTTWTKVPVAGCAATLTSIVVQDATHGWAVGDAGTVLVCATNCNLGTAVWKTLTSASKPPTTVNLTGLRAPSGNKVYAVGAAGASGAVWSCSANCNVFNTATWNNITPTTPSLLGLPLAGVSGSGAGFTIAVGTNGTVLVCATGTCTATSWTKRSLGSMALNGVYAADANTVYATAGSSGLWACATSCSSATSTWARITPTNPTTPTALNGVGGSGSVVWAVGPGGLIHYCPSSCAADQSYWVGEANNWATTSFAAVAAASTTTARSVGNAGAIVGTTANTVTTSALSSAIASLGTTLRLGYWANTGNNVVTDVGAAAVFNAATQAVSSLTGVAGQTANIDRVVGAMRLLVTTEVSNNSCSPQQSQKLSSASQELGQGDSAYDKGLFSQAVNHYQNAWGHAQGAAGTPCVTAGITAPGPSFAVVYMVPGDTAINPPVTVSVTGTSAPTVGLYEQTPTGTLLPALHLQIVQAGKASPVYDGPLDNHFAYTAASPLILAGSGSGGSWPAGESHTFTFTVTFPPQGSADNAYQNAPASVQFVWERS